MSEHQWVDSTFAHVVNYPMQPAEHKLQQVCSVCGQGRMVPVPDGFAGGFGIGCYFDWDGVTTCEQRIARDAAEREKWQRADAERKQRIEYERPRREAFLAGLNALCAEHGAHLAESDEYGAAVVLESAVYVLGDDGETVT